MILGFRSILRGIDEKFKYIKEHINLMEDMMSQMDDEIQTLKNDVASERTAVDSAVALIQGFAQQLADAIAAAQAAGATNQQLSDLNDLHSAVSQQTQDLANAVANQSPSASSAPPGTAAPSRNNP